MSKAEPVLLIILLTLVITTLAARITWRYMASSMTLLDCRLGYYGLMSFASYAHPVTTEENREWIAMNVSDGHFLFSKSTVSAHPMVVRRRIQVSGEHLDVVTEGCAFGNKDAYDAALTKLPPALKSVPEGQQNIQLKAVLEQ